MGVHWIGPGVQRGWLQLRNVFGLSRILLWGLWEVMLLAQSSPSVAKDVVIAPFGSVFNRVESCGRILDFVMMVEPRQAALRTQLNRRFSGCAVHDVPYGVYRVKGETDTFYFEGTCKVENPATVYIPVIPFDNAYRLGEGVFEFQLEGAKTSPQPLWLNVKPVFYGALAGRGRNVVPYPRDPESTVFFDEFGSH